MGADFPPRFVNRVAAIDVVHDVKLQCPDHISCVFHNTRFSETFKRKRLLVAIIGTAFATTVPSMEQGRFFERLLDVIDTDAKDTTLPEVDSKFCKVHQSARLALKDRAIGVSLGGKFLTSKKPLNFLHR
ncbi:MAG: hypothetical protein IJQ82_14715 [Selenomonadaceae bacterium]|nr:hypothetical protein [Selenomonadaceae bacterium]